MPQVALTSLPKPLEVLGTSAETEGRSAMYCTHAPCQEPRPIWTCSQLLD